MAIDTELKRRSSLGNVGFQRILPGPPDGGDLGTPGERASMYGYSGLVTAGATFTSYAGPFIYTAAEWASPVFKHKVYMRATTGQAEARLFDETAAAAVAGSTLTTASNSFVYLESGALTLVDGNTYRVQTGKAGGDVGEVLMQGLVVR